MDYVGGGSDVVVGDVVVGCNGGGGRVGQLVVAIEF